LTAQINSLIGMAHAGGLVEEMRNRAKAAGDGSKDGGTSDHEKRLDGTITDKSDQASSPLGMKELEGGFLLYAIGIGVAIAVFLVELATKQSGWTSAKKITEFHVV
jgi:hypothetical protein